MSKHKHAYTTLSVEDAQITVYLHIQAIFKLREATFFMRACMRYTVQFKAQAGTVNFVPSALFSMQKKTDRDMAI